MAKLKFLASIFIVLMSFALSGCVIRQTAPIIAPSPASIVQMSPSQSSVPIIMNMIVIDPLNTDPTTSDFELIKGELRTQITPDVLKAAGVDLGAKEDIVDNIKNMCGIDESTPDKKVVLVINRSMINNGVKVFYEGPMNKFNLKTATDFSLEDQYAAIQKGMNIFSNITGLPVSMVHSKEEANIVLEAPAGLDRPRSSLTGEVHGSFQTETGRLNGLWDEIGVDMRLYDVEPSSYIDFSSVKDPVLKARMEKAVKTVAWTYSTVHELGHAFGYRIHSSNPKSIMSAQLDIRIKYVDTPEIFTVGFINSDTNNAAYKVARLLVAKGM